MASKKNTILVILAVIIVIGLILTGVIVLRKKNTTPGVTAPSVGSIDRDKVMQTIEIKQATEKMEKIAEDIEKQFNEETRTITDANKKNEIYLKYQNKMMEESAKILKPVIDKSIAAVAVVALENKMTAVLDKRVTVYGAKDITEDVIARLKSGQEIKAPDEKLQKEVWDKSTIGYFDKNVIMSLPAFRDAEKKYQEIEAQYARKFEQETRGIRDRQRIETLRAAYTQELMKMKDDMLAPLYRDVNRTVKEIAETEKLDLVVNKEYVMFGGRNVTDNLADKMSGVKKETK